jgi:hypothetical protein
VESPDFAIFKRLIEETIMPHYTVHNDPDLTEWLRWAFELGNTGIFIRTLVEVAYLADMPSYVLLRPVLLEFMRRNPRPAPAETP